LTHEGTYYISRLEFLLLKNIAILINASRGFVVIEKALILALQGGELLGPVWMFVKENLRLNPP
jgi:phosphoglycerate dehydrogenase-like enzyme